MPYYAPYQRPVNENEFGVDNNKGSRDAVVALVPNSPPQADPEIVVYVQAGDGFSCKGIPEGTYYTYVIAGEDWDSYQYRFTRFDSYSRFVEAQTFSDKPWYHTVVTITLGGVTTSSPSVTVPPSQFPRLR